MLWRIPPARRRLPSGFIEPCLATRMHVVPAGPRWVHEIKHDGYRFICRLDGGRTQVFTRRGHDWTDRVPGIAAALAALPARSATIDGEGVICRDDGVTDFDALRLALARRKAPSAFLYAFDLMELDGRDMRREPWDVRRAVLEHLLADARPGLQLSEHMDGDGDALFRHACAFGLEGIVSKRRDARYVSGRCDHWVKVKNPDAPAMTRGMHG
jgi:bifunctional non-homologous end joining protein LigD